MLNAYTQRQRMKRMTADERFLRDVRAEACQQMGVQLRHVREAVAHDYHAQKAPDCRGRKIMPHVSCETIDNIAKDPTRPKFHYIGADEPLAQRGNPSPFADQTDGLGLEALVRYLLETMAAEANAHPNA
jgi:hypothetical protein